MITQLLMYKLHATKNIDTFMIQLISLLCIETRTVETKTASISNCIDCNKRLNFAGHERHSWRFVKHNLDLIDIHTPRKQYVKNVTMKSSLLKVKSSI